MPEPTKVPSAPSCITRAASAGVPRLNRGAGIRGRRDPAGEEQRPLQPAGPGHLGDDLEGRTEVLGGARELLGTERSELLEAADDVAQVADRLDDVPGARLTL